MTHAPLLVPVAVEALVVNAADRRGTMWSRTSRHHIGARQLLAIDPPPFVRGSESVRTGVTVHWLLPDALTRGRWHGPGDDRRLLHPYIPDRWLVVRLTGGSASPATKQWLIESDFYGDRTLGTNPYPVDGGITYLGRSVELVGATNLVSSIRQPSLTAVGREMGTNGTTPVLGDHDPSWAASAVNVGDILAFHDDLVGLHDRQAMTLSYAVVGWYSNPELADPMVDQTRLGEELAARSTSSPTVDEWHSIMDALGWTVGDEVDLLAAQRAAADPNDVQLSWLDEIVPSRTVCHGCVIDVTWTGIGGEAQPFTRGANSAFAGSAIRSRAGWRNPATGAAGATGDFPDIAPGMSASDVTAVREPGRSGATATGRAPYPQVAIGTSLADALSGMTEYLVGLEQGGDNPSDVSTLLQALEHHLLDAYQSPEGSGVLQRQLHQDGFVSAPGGVWWDVATQHTVAEIELPPMTELLDAMDEHDPSLQLASRLGSLNAKQAELDTTTRRLVAERREASSLWWKSRRLDSAPLGGVSDDELADLDGTVDAALQASMAECGRLESTASRLQGDVDNEALWLTGRLQWDLVGTAFLAVTGSSLGADRRLPVGDVLVVDATNHRVGRVAADGVISTVAGDGVEGFAGDGGPAGAARLSSPRGVAVDAVGNIYVADSGNHRVRRVGVDGVISTVAGDGVEGFAGDGGEAVVAQLSSPSWVAVDAAGRLDIADTGNRRVRRVDVDGAIRTVADASDVAFELLQRRSPRFFAPADPVIVISGARASSKHGGDGRYRADGRLLVRFGRASDAARGQTLEPTNGGGTPLAVAGPLLGLLADEQFDHVRLAAADLLGEFAALVDADRDSGNTLPFRGVWREPTTNEGSVAAVVEAAGFDGVRPSPVAVEKWAQPWRPLHLCWRASWYPTSSPFDWETGWIFDAEADYEWLGLNNFDHDSALTVQGRCLLGAAPTQPLRDALDAITTLHEGRMGDSRLSGSASSARGNDLAALRRSIDEIQQRLSSADLLVQAFSGFHDQLVQRDRTQRQLPDIPPDLQSTDQVAPTPFESGSAASPFTPYRNGHLRIRRLWLVDGFGQVFDLIAEQGQTDDSFAPLRGRGVATIGVTQRADTQMVQLAPRLVQPSRLRMQFEAAHGSPVRGWLLSNRLDRSIMVYDAEGRALGAVARWHGTGAASVVWQPAVGASGVIDPAGIADQRLRDVVTAIDGFDAEAFGAFGQAIDRTLWTTDPLGDRGGSLSALVGRPIAVVTARCWIELDGPPLLDQLWSLTGAPRPARSGGVDTLQVPIRLGLPGSRSDGTLGHFDADHHFHSVLRPLEWTTDTVVASHPDSWPRVPVLDHGNLTSDRPDVTILFDPRGAVHASTGLLPTKSFRLGGQVIDGPLATMDASFRVGPLLTAEEVRMPLPADIRDGWSWLEAAGVGLAPTAVPVAAVSGVAALDGWPSRIREGWLHLSDVVNPSSDEEDR